MTIEDIHGFFKPINVPQGGVHLMNGANGRPSGLAYVELTTEADQKEAVKFDKQTIGGRYIDIFPCSQNELQARLAVQGNLDPRVPVEGGEPMEQAVRAILEALGQGPFVFNLGHGILLQTPPAHVERLIQIVREGGA